MEASLEGPWLVRWDLEARLQGGLQAVAPAAWLAGVEVGATGELGHRLLLQGWSPYLMVGGRLRSDHFTEWMVQEDDAWIQRTLRSLEVAPRLGLGVAFLDARRSFRAVLFARAAWRATNYAGGATATSLGLSAGYDVADGLSVLAEAAVVTQPAFHTPGLALVDRRTTRTADVSIRKVLRSGSWFGLGLAFARNYDQLRYLDSGLALSTSNPAALSATVSYGMHLGD